MQEDSELKTSLSYIERLYLKQANKYKYKTCLICVLIIYKEIIIEMNNKLNSWFTFFYHELEYKSLT